MILTASSSSALQSLAQLAERNMDVDFPSVATRRHSTDHSPKNAASGDTYARLLAATKELTRKVAQLTAEVATIRTNEPPQMSPADVLLLKPQSLRAVCKKLSPALFVLRKRPRRTVSVTTVSGPGTFAWARNRFYVTHRIPKVCYLVDTGAQICVLPPTLLHDIFSPDLLLLPRLKVRPSALTANRR
ncbi:hypothetical protein HPB52_009129 [Rhipicephalus sanguineus]|uniref:Peptidase A2 domain-containing protein n=1 Tax=Rhipicephalus sanguineus TaxID=34632 RepID=A0A9D4QAG3_RHISA|nr:hypothetical protein HPB52_009129 [Rhipicephalus sanguineus]